MSNQRAHYRLDYPHADRPMLVIETRQCPVLDLSEKGCKFLLPKGFRPAPKTRFRGTIHFKSGKTCEIDGHVLRVLPEAETCVLILTVGVPLTLMMEEQRLLIKKYKAI